MTRRVAGGGLSIDTRQRDRLSAVLFADVSILAPESSFSCPWSMKGCSALCIKPRCCVAPGLSTILVEQLHHDGPVGPRSSMCKSLSVIRSEHSRDVITSAVKASNDNLPHARLETTCSLTLYFFMHSLNQIRAWYDLLSWHRQSEIFVSLRV